MSIVKIAIRDFRNIKTAELDFSSQLNLITGLNGAGKTSLLEAVHYLGRTQSFKTTHLTSLFRTGAESLLVTGQITDRFGGVTPVGVQRDKKSVRVRMAGKPVQQLSNLVQCFPFQLLTPDSHQLFEGGPRYRRRFIDWGVFHVEPAFLPLWQRFTHVLRQRNAALRSKSTVREIRLWDSELVASAVSLDLLRRDYLEVLLAVLNQYLTEFIDITDLTWEYQSGWSKKLELSEALAESLEGDRRQGFTRVGPHRADFVPILEGQPAQERISRGQQKQLVSALMLAQARIYQEKKGQPCIFLIDDLASELDSDRRAYVLRNLEQLGTQVFLTSIEASAIESQIWSQQSRFHVEHGRIEEVI